MTRVLRTVTALSGLLLLVAPLPFEAGTASAAKRVLQVGPTRELATPAAAAAAAQDGDVIEIDAGTYPGGVAVWRANRLTIRAVGAGRAHMQADGEDAEGKAIWVIKGNNVKVIGIEFSGAEVRDGNGAGIRHEGTGLTLRDCYFHDNENGLLAGDNAKSRIVIEYSIFENNGAGDGFTHNIYVNEIKRFILRYSYVHHAVTGHNVKSRAKRTDILYNRIGDEDSGTASYAIDVPSGGDAYVIGNAIQQGPDAENSIVVAYGAEGYEHKRNRLYLVHNTIVNDRSAGTFLAVWGEPRDVRILNNLFVGKGEWDQEAGWTIGGNLERQSDPGFIGRAEYDYALAAGSSAIDAGVAVSLKRLEAKFEYRHPTDREKRTDAGKPDVGAFAR